MCDITKDTRKALGEAYRFLEPPQSKTGFTANAVAAGVKAIEALCWELAALRSELKKRNLRKA